MKGVKKEVLDNGITLYMLKIPEARTIGISAIVGIGSIYEDKNKRGISHLLEHILSLSNMGRSYGSFIRFVELSGGIANAYTSRFLSYYMCETIPESFEKVANALFQMLDRKRFEKNTFKREKNAVLSEMENIGKDSIDNLIPIAVFGESDYGD
ncbi:MAG: insulinase family protein, partial [Candidatus Aenigmarchaeota archaeon]|nr:insulinase family protein [Candidatus Aenigmarchaeota archaeon]MDW8149767.1 insulinase family protein [Candidatus Aenigmarchaeota archaeon]